MIKIPGCIELILFEGDDEILNLKNP